MLDLGAGFGRIMLEAAKSGATVIGYETDPVKVFWINRQIEIKFHFRRMWTQGLASGMRYNPYKYDEADITTSVRRENLLNADLSKADVVYAYLSPPLMQKIGEKAQKEMKVGARIISAEHRIDGWQPSFEDKKMKIYVYIKT
jgi:adenine-specific DNA methylase